MATRLYVEATALVNRCKIEFATCATSSRGFYSCQYKLQLMAHDDRIENLLAVFIFGSLEYFPNTVHILNAVFAITHPLQTLPLVLTLDRRSCVKRIILKLYAAVRSSSAEMSQRGLGQVHKGTDHAIPFVHTWILNCYEWFRQQKRCCNITFKPHNRNFFFHFLDPHGSSAMTGVLSVHVK